MEKQLIIPEPKPITEIKEYEYAGREDITSVVILNSITKIGMWAFRDCTSLAEITIPNSVTEIEEFAFFCCEALTSVTIPDSVTVIRQNVFEGCTGLKEIIIPNSVTEIEFMAFCDCESLTTVNIPESVTKIEGNAFECCTGLKAVAIPEAVTVMEDAFIDCPNLTVLLSKNSKLQDGVFKGCKEVIRVDNPAAELEKIKKTLKNKNYE